MAPNDSTEQVLQGTLDLLILKTLSLAPMHGWGLTHRIQQLSRDAFQVGQGSIYPALVRLEQRGLISTEWGNTENNRRAKYYRISAAGRRAMGDEARELEALRRCNGSRPHRDEVTNASGPVTPTVRCAQHRVVSTPYNRRRPSH